MGDATTELSECFALPGQTELPPDILGELQSILRLHSITPEELYFKWESYCLKMGSEETKLDLTTARAFKKDIQEMLERDSRGKAHARNGEKKGVHTTPRNASTKGGDVFDMFVLHQISSKQQANLKGLIRRPIPHECPRQMASARPPSKRRFIPKSIGLLGRAPQQMEDQHLWIPMARMALRTGTRKCREPFARRCR